MYTRANTLRPFMLLTGFLVMMASFISASSSHAQVVCCRAIVTNNSSCTIGTCITTHSGQRCFFITAGTSDTLDLPGCPTITLSVRDVCGNPITFPPVVGTCVRTPVKDPTTGAICCVDICYLGSCTWVINPAGPCNAC